jgi:hypothetical protein
MAATLLRRLPTSLTEDWKLLTGQALAIAYNEDKKWCVRYPLLASFFDSVLHTKDGIISGRW